MNILKPLLFSFCFLLLFGCKKERLKPTDEMVGEWEWVYSKYTHTRYAGMQQYKTYVFEFSPNGIGRHTNYSASMKIKDNGKILLSKSGKEYYKLSSDISNNLIGNYYFDSILSEEILVVVGFPLENYNESYPKSDYAITSNYFYDNISPSFVPKVYNYFKRK